MPSVKKNFIYNSLLTISSYLFPLITYPYVSRVLGVTNIGVCNYVDSIITYFCMFSMLGLTISGIREIASVRGDEAKRNLTFSSLMVLNGITTAIAMIGLLVAIQTVHVFQENSRLMYIGAVKLLFNSLLIEWFFKGMENFKYITLRSILVRTIYTVSVFVFIKTTDDYWIYYLLTVSTIVINAIVNIAFSRHFVRFSFKGINLRPYVSGFFIMGIYLVVTSLYTTFNVVYLGSVTNKTEVGYYTTAHKLFTLIIAIYTAFTNVMMPRMTYLLAEGKTNEFKEYINKSISVLLSIAVPIVIFSCIFSQEIISVLSGSGYEGAIIPMRIMMPLVLIIGYEQILVIQALMPLKKDKIVFRNSVIGAIVGISLNLLLVKSMASVGSSIVWLCCEVVVLIMSQINVNRIVGIEFPYSVMVKNLAVYSPIGLFFWFIHKGISNPFVVLVISGGLLLIYFVMSQKYVIKNQYIISALSCIEKKFRHIR